MPLVINALSLPGCKELVPSIVHDNRGCFIKIFNKRTFEELGLVTDYFEEYITYSHSGVLRGMHFQAPPLDHVKFVQCLSGSVLDVLVDLRVGSPAYGNHIMLELSANRHNIIYMPKGIAHGFYVQSKEALLLYKTSSDYSPEHDCGILWNSLDIPWPVENPVLSERDGRFEKFIDFESPFLF